MQARRIANALGADVTGLDLSKPISKAEAGALHDLWLEHLVLRFRGQALTPPQLIEFSRHFGDLERHDNYQGELRHPIHPELLVVKSREVGGRRITFGQQWHSDLSYTVRPSKGSVLQCLALPPVGGDTLFSNMYLAYDELSPAMKRIVDPLECVHDLTHGRSHQGTTRAQHEATLARNPPVIQPVVRKHPETGRKALFVSEWMCTRIVGMSDQEGRGIIDFLCRHSTREEFTFRQQWQVGDVLMWDNRATVHMALADYPSHAHRELLRTSITGSPSGRPVEGVAAGTSATS